MSKNKGKITDVQILGICHFIGLVVLSFFGANVFNLVERFSGNVLTYILLPINRSMWEFGKMLFVCMSIIYTIEYFIVGRRIKNFIPVHLIVGSLLPIVLIIILSMFNFFFGSLSMEGAQAVLFLTLIIASFMLSIAWVASKQDVTKYFVPFLILYIVLCGLFVLFSFVRPELKMFFDYGANSYGPMY